MLGALAELEGDVEAEDEGFVFEDDEDEGTQGVCVAYVHGCTLYLCRTNGQDARRCVQRFNQPDCVQCEP